MLVHAFGAVMDNPDLLALAVVGDGEAETGPLEGSWKGISFLNPARDGAVLPILHLNGAKIAGPTVLGRKDPAEVRVAARGPRLRGHRGRGRRPARHAPPLRRRAGDGVRRGSGPSRQPRAAADWDGARPRWPMIVLRTPEGLDRPRRGRRGAGRRHLAVPPGAAVRRPGEPRAPARSWRSGCAPTGPRSSSTTTAPPPSSCGEPTPPAPLRMSATPHANGGLADAGRSTCPTSATTRSTCRRPATRARTSRPAARRAAARRCTSATPTAFRLFCPDETNSNRLGAVFEVSDRAFMERVTARRREALATTAG